MNNLQELRSQLDKIDKEIIDALGKRFEIIHEVGKLKKQRGHKILDEKRWENVLKLRKEIAKSNNIRPEFIEKIYNAIHEYALDIEKELQK
jgi:chorismate mutase